MKFSAWLLTIHLVVPSLIGGAIAQDRSTGTSTTNMAPMPAPVIEAYKRVRMDIMKGIDAPLSGQADVDFARNMIPHHQAAVAMAKIELQFGTDPDLKKMAEKMIADQEKEIGMLSAWLAKHGK